MDYKKAYFTLFNGITDFLQDDLHNLNILKNAQLATEEMFITTEPLNKLDRQINACQVKLDKAIEEHGVGSTEFSVISKEMDTLILSQYKKVYNLYSEE